MFQPSDIDKFNALRPDLTRLEVEDVMSFICDQVSAGAIFSGTDESVFLSAAEYAYPFQFWAALKVHRKAKGLSQDAMAAKIGVSRDTYKNYEYARRPVNPNINTLRAICRALGISADELLELKP